MGNSWGGLGMVVSKESTVALSSLEQSILESAEQHEQHNLDVTKDK